MKINEDNEDNEENQYDLEAGTYYLGDETIINQKVFDAIILQRFDGNAGLYHIDYQNQKGVFLMIKLPTVVDHKSGFDVICLVEDSLFSGNVSAHKLVVQSITVEIKVDKTINIKSKDRNGKLSVLSF